MITKRYIVESYVTVTVDETKFTEEFMDEFRQSFYKFNNLDDHMRYIASLAAGGTVFYGDQFVEGYGHIKDYSIDADVDDVDVVEDC